MLIEYGIIMKKLWGILFGLLLIPFAGAETIYVAVASNFLKPVREIASQFQQQSHDKIIISDASIGVLSNQIKNGAPYEVFLSADSATPALLAKQKYAVESTQFTYAYGQLVLLSSSGKLDNPLQRLQSGNYTHLSICDPKITVYGAAGYQVLNKYQLLPKIQDKLVVSENIKLAFDYVVTKNAELGFVALSQVILDKNIARDDYWIIPDSVTPLIKQDAILLTKGQNSKGAQQFLAYLKSDAAKKIINRYGYK